MRWMMFVDGEGFSVALRERLEARLPDAKREDFLPRGGDYEEGVFMWAPRGHLNPLQFYVGDGLRAYFYTSMRGDDDAMNRKRDIIRAHGFDPQVFKKTDKTRPAKGVDIALARHMLTHAIDDHYDFAYLLAGDGDYLPLVEEVKARGKQVRLGYFEGDSSLNKELLRAADAFVDLTNMFVGAWTGFFGSRRT